MTFAANFHFGIDLDHHSHDLLRHDGKTNGLLQRLDEGFDLITLEDGFALSAGDGLDAILFANWLGARTSHAGIVAGAPINFLEPFHVSTAIATLDYVTDGRAGLLVQPLEGNRAVAARRATGAGTSGSITQLIGSSAVTMANGTYKVPGGMTLRLSTS